MFVVVGIEDPKRYLAESLGALARAQPGLLGARLPALAPTHRAALQAYLAAYSVQVQCTVPPHWGVTEP